MGTEVLKHGVAARLFPVVPESAKEQRTLSIVLAAMLSVRPFAERLLAPLPVKMGKRATINCFTEVTLTNEVKGLRDRPDALIIVESGKNVWSALVEAKIGKHVIETEQLDRYVELAKLNGIDAVITVSNVLTPAPDINPTSIGRALPKNLNLYHFSWASILTTAFLLASSNEDQYNNDDEAFIISELIRYLEHNSSGLVPLDQMNKEWPKIVGDVQSSHPLNAKSDDVIEMITTWLQEARDVALNMTRRLKEPVSIVASRANLGNPSGWIDEEAKRFVLDKQLSFELDVPNAASKILVEADFLRRAIRVSMKLAAPTDRASNAARLNWLLKQLTKSNRERVIIRCITRGKAQNFGAMADEIDPKSEEIRDLSEIVSFQLEMSTDLGAKFNSRKKFIECLEEIVPDFYDNVGQHLQAFVPPPPRYNKAEDVAAEKGSDSNGVDSGVSGKVERAKQLDRPAWAVVWQVPEAVEPKVE